MAFLIFVSPSSVDTLTEIVVPPPRIWAVSPSRSLASTMLSLPWEQPLYCDFNVTGSGFFGSFPNILLVRSWIELDVDPFEAMTRTIRTETSPSTALESWRRFEPSRAFDNMGVPAISISPWSSLTTLPFGIVSVVSPLTRVPSSICSSIQVRGTLTEYISPFRISHIRFDSDTCFEPNSYWISWMRPVQDSFQSGRSISNSSFYNECSISVLDFWPATHVLPSKN